MISVILLMAGSATRMKSKENKVFLPLGKKRIFEYSLDLFLELGLEVICVIRKDEAKYLKKYASSIHLVEGGATRQESVYHGILAATQPLVLIHDAARPWIEKKVIESCILSLKNGRRVLVGCPCVDTVYQKEPLEVLSRENLFQAQTPQGASREDFLYAHQKAIEEHTFFTDDISLVNHYLPKETEVILASERNFKITTPMDYILAKEMIKHD